MQSCKYSYNGAVGLNYIVVTPSLSITRPYRFSIRLLAARYRSISRIDHDEDRLKKDTRLKDIPSPEAELHVCVSTVHRCRRCPRSADAVRRDNQEG